MGRVDRTHSSHSQLKLCNIFLLIVAYEDVQDKEDVRIRDSSK